ncbi:MAG: tetratricopeptide repeat protein [Myxococcales bacterium]|nr:tetratricopeptide repeat protein [Myxococcales bacterium]
MIRVDIPQAIAAASQALQAGDPQAALSALAPLMPLVDSDPEAAAARLSLWRALPGQPGLRQEVGRILDAWPDDVTLITRACDALIRDAERIPIDQPAPEGGSAQLAADAAERCLAAHGQGSLDPMLEAYLLVNRGNALRLLHRHEEAQTCLEQALERDAERAGWWFNLGLVHKARRAFGDGLKAYRRARELMGDERPLLWNLAICAIGSGKGAAAVEALRALGHDAQLTPRGMPYVADLPPLQVRVATVGSGLGPEGVLPERSVGFELLWVTPLSPCHGVVASASYRQASADFGDLVLWDGTPVDVVEHAGKPLPRFPLLGILRKGEEHIFRYVALQQQKGQVAAFGETLPGDGRIFIHREQVEHLCSRCASGEHMHKHEHTAPEEHMLVYGKIVLPAGTDLSAWREALGAALARHPGVQLVMPGLHEAIGDSPAAGKAHQLWRGLEKRGQRLEQRTP